MNKTAIQIDKFTGETSRITLSRWDIGSMIDCCEIYEENGKTIAESAECRWIIDGNIFA